MDRIEPNMDRIQDDIPHLCASVFCPRRGATPRSIRGPEVSPTAGYTGDPPPCWACTRGGSLGCLAQEVDHLYNRCTGAVELPGPAGPRSLREDQGSQVTRRGADRSPPLDQRVLVAPRGSAPA